MWCKKPTNPAIYSWNNQVYDLTIPDDFFAVQYQALINYFQIFQTEELKLALRDPNRSLVEHPAYILSITDVRVLPLKDNLKHFLNGLKITGFNNFYGRFKNTITNIHIGLDPTFLYKLKGRFFKAHTDKTVYDREGEILPVVADWLACEQRIPWVWLLPHYQQAFIGETQWQTQLKSFFERLSLLNK